MRMKRRRETPFSEEEAEENEEAAGKMERREKTNRRLCVLSSGRKCVDIFDRNDGAKVRLSGVSW